MPTTPTAWRSIRTAAKELRLFGLADWIVERFRLRAAASCELHWQATRLRERPVVWSLLLVLAANIVVFWSLASRGSGRQSRTRPAGDVRDRRRVSTSMIAFGGLSWALDGAAAPVAAVLRLRRGDGARRCARPRATGRPPACPRARSASATSRSLTRRASEPVLEGFDLTIPAGSSLAIVGQNGAGKTTLAKLLCRLYDPQAGRDRGRRQSTCAPRPRRLAIAGDRGLPGLHSLRAAAARQRGAAGAPGRRHPGSARRRRRGGPGRSRHDPGARLRGRHRAFRRPVAARGAGPALCAVRQGAGVVLLDEPTAQLDVRGEAEIFDRILAATRHTTTILISHRFSTVRHADRICVLEDGQVVELGTHDELMAAGGRYRTMFDLQASRFGERRGRGRSRPRCPRRDDLPPALPAMWRALKRGYQAEPWLLSRVVRAVAAGRAARRAAGALAQAARRRRAWLGNRALVLAAAVGLGVSATATWFLRVISDRTAATVSRPLTIALESHVARLQASVATIEHHERPEYLDRLAVLRDQVFVLDHMYMSLFSTCGWILRLGVTLACS